ncbi:MAG: TetR/AcrR family transcriptional regulator [Deltaproteobacteria bacterium]|nr:TetR/AcrR family transcriptional regulator [Deltaproteobacteria bacterium]MBW1923480.1 TetR/AcrR family transcriptional regulator [Deltaproteobacteria bacterium]MBW1948673.1 TetR/AcrR family transcriptional regulator [Deltaproteobacteria bacterium]MBW2007225.1 TetR/AcrR family transcriptional regulator [Deltaproteobacteria bacterium]MBW2101600.1 TetR/AcrR family transcriptional regulator [Deltaproteobacteria bacterium]
MSGAKGAGARPGPADKAVAGGLQRLRREERLARRRLILDTARELFSERDFRSVTARQIAKRAGFSTGVIYRYFTHLDELFLEVFFEGARELTARVEEAMKEAGGTCILERFCETYVTYLNENMTFYQMMGYFMLGGRLSPQAAAEIDTTMRPLMDRVEQAVRGAGISGDTRLAAHALFSALNGIMISYAKYPGRSLQEIERHTLRLTREVAHRFGGRSGHRG